MNDYAKLIAHAAARFTAKPAVLSPLLDSYSGWENKRSRFSTEPTLGNFCIVLSTAGLLPDELDIEIELVEVPKDEGKKGSTGKKEEPEKEGFLKISLKHGSKDLRDNSFKWSRDCTYKFAIDKNLSEISSHFAAYWTNDDFLIIQARNLENKGAYRCGLRDLNKFKLIPTEVIDVLEPALNIPFLKQTLRAINKKSSEVFSYVNAATEVPDTQDVLSLLTCIPTKEEKKMAYDLKKEIADTKAGLCIQDDDDPKISE